MKVDSKYVKTLLFVGVVALAGCGAPTVETKRAVTTYKVTGLSGTAVADTTVSAVRKRVSKANVQRTIAPASLPAKPGALEVKDALAGSNLGALTGGALVASCDGAMVVIRAGNTDFAGYGESTEYTICVWPYRGAVNVDVYSSFTETSGGVSPAELGKQIASSAFGNSSQFIGKMHDSIVAALQSAGGTVTTVSQR